MHKLLIALSIVSITAFALIPQLPTTPAAAETLDPLLPDAGEDQSSTTPQTTAVASPAIVDKPAIIEPLAEAPKPASTESAHPGTPKRLIIPAINLNNPVVAVGLTASGEMDVPAGTTRNVGWYKNGTLPGAVGSAVMDAHVFAAFKRLDELRVGSDLYVETTDGTRLHYVVEETKTYVLKDMDKAVARTIFNRTDAKRLNLITCAGSLTADRSTYTHRLVVFAKLVE